MARGSQYPFWTHDTAAAAVLASVGAASLQIKLDTLANELNIPLFTACVHGWPMLLIFAAVVLLLVQPGDEDRWQGRQEAEGIHDEDVMVGFTRESQVGAGEIADRGEISASISQRARRPAAGVRASSPDCVRLRLTPLEMTEYFEHPDSRWLEQAQPKRSLAGAAAAAEHPAKSRLYLPTAGVGIDGNPRRAWKGTASGSGSDCGSKGIFALISQRV